MPSDDGAVCATLEVKSYLVKTPSMGQVGVNAVSDAEDPENLLVAGVNIPTMSEVSQKLFDNLVSTWYSHWV